MLGATFGGSISGVLPGRFDLSLFFADLASCANALIVGPFGLISASTLRPLSAWTFLVASAVRVPQYPVGAIGLLQVKRARMAQHGFDLRGIAAVF